MPSYYQVKQQDDVAGNVKPENLHLCIENLAGTYLYFVDSADNKILKKLDVSDGSVTTVETRANKSIARIWHDRDSGVLYCVDCEYDDTTSYVWSLDLSTDIVTEIESIPADVFDIWRYNSETWVVFFGTIAYTLENDDILPNTDSSVEWSVIGAAQHWDAIDDPGIGKYILENDVGNTDIFGMETIDMTGYDSAGVIDQIYQITCYFYGYGPNAGDAITISGNKTGLTAQDKVIFNGTWKWWSVSWSGLSLTQADLDDLEITITAKTIAVGFVYISGMYCRVYFYGDDTTALMTVRNIDTDTSYTNNMGVQTGRKWNISQMAIVGADFHFNWKWSNENVECWRFQTGDNSFDELEDCGATTELPTIQQGALAYDDSDILYFVLGLGTAEVSTIVAEVPGNVNDGEYINYSAIELDYENVRSEKAYYIWFDKVGDESGDPAPADKTKITVDISAAVTAQDVSDAIETAVNAVTIITCDNAAGTTCTLTCHYNGNTTNIADVDTGWVVATTVPGVANIYYLYTYSIANDALTQVAEWNIALMLNRNTDSTALIPFNLEKAYDLDLDVDYNAKIFQLARNRGTLNYISKITLEAGSSILAITDHFVIIDRNGGNVQLWEYVDYMNTGITKIKHRHPTFYNGGLPEFDLYAYKSLAQFLEKDMFIQIVGSYSSYFNTGLLAFYNAPDNFNDETAGAITVAGDMAWIDTLTLPDTCSATLGTVDNHKNVLGISHAGVDDPIVIHEFEAQEATGTYEWWWGSSDVTRNQTIRFKGTGIAVYLRINASKYYYIDSLDAAIEIIGDTPTNDELDHFKLVWDCATDTFDLYINGTIRVTGGEFNNPDTYIDELYMASITGAVYTQYIDAPGNVADANYYEGQNLVKTDENGVPMEGIIYDYSLQNIPDQKFRVRSLAFYELTKIFPNISDYTNYTGKTSGEIITQLLSDYCVYVTAGTIVNGVTTWTCPADWKAEGDKNLLTVINELAETEIFVARIRPRGELDFDNASVSTSVSILSTSDLVNVKVHPISETINYVKIWGGYVGAVPVGPVTSENVQSQQLHGGITPWYKTVASITDLTALQTYADNKLTLLSQGPVVVNLILDGNVSGMIQPAETLYIDADVDVAKSDATVPVGTYIIMQVSYDPKNEDITLTLSDGLVGKQSSIREDPAMTLPQENNQLIRQLGTNIQRGVYPNPSPALGDHQAEGIKTTLTAGENLVFGEVCYIKADGKAWKADADDTTKVPSIALSIATISADVEGEFLLYGFVRDDSWAWTVGNVLYLSTTAGDISTTKSNYRLGVATHADRMFFNPEVSSGIKVTEDSGNPTITPNAVGDIYINTDNLKMFMAADTNGSYNWGYIGKAQLSAFTKDSVASLVGWYDADEANITKDGSDNVSEWADLSDAGNDLTVVPATEPVWYDDIIGGYPAVYANSNSYIAKDAVGPYGTDHSVFIVFKPTNIGVGGAQIFVGFINNNTITFGKINGAINSKIHNWGTTLTGNTLLTNRIDLFSCIYNGANSILQRNDEIAVEGPVDAISAAARIVLFADGDKASNMAAGYIAEVLIYSDPLSEANIEIVKEYLNNKYAIW